MKENKRASEHSKREPNESRKRSNANLKIFNSKTASAAGKKGGRASQAVQREKRTLREALEILLSLPSKKRKGMSTLESGCVELVQEFERGNLRAWELLRDTIGQKPTEADNKHVTGNVYVSWQGSSGESVKAVTNGRTSGVQIDTTAQAPAQAPAEQHAGG